MNARSALPLLPLVLVLFAACAGEREDSLSQELAQRWLDAMNSHDVARVVSLFSPDATVVGPASSAPLSREEHAAKLKEDWRVWHDQVFTPRVIHVTSDTAVVEWRAQQTHPTGKHLDYEGVAILDVEGNVIRGLRMYFNPVIFLPFLTKAP